MPSAPLRSTPGEGSQSLSGLGRLCLHLPRWRVKLGAAGELFPEELAAALGEFAAALGEQEESPSSGGSRRLYLSRVVSAMDRMWPSPRTDTLYACLDKFTATTATYSSTSYITVGY